MGISTLSFWTKYVSFIIFHLPDPAASFMTFMLHLIFSLYRIEIDTLRAGVYIQVLNKERNLKI